MNPLEYLHLQLRLEGKEVIHGNLLRQVEIVPNEEMPLMLIGFLSTQEQVAYYDELLPSTLLGDLNGKFHFVLFPDIGPVLHFLQSQGFNVNVGHYKTYIFPAYYKTLASEGVAKYARHDPKAKAFGFDGFSGEVHAIEREGRIVSACVSTRENGQCGEAWVFTDPQYRRQGFARQVVSAWSRDRIATGKVPFYSHRIENTASANLARRLGLVPVYEEMVISYA